MKFTILGAAGGIGQSLALLLKNQLPDGSELALYDIAPVIKGVSVDLSHIPTEVKISGFTGKDISLAIINSDVIFICAGLARKPGMTRSDLFNFNASIITNLIDQIIKTSSSSLIGIITNPVNSTTVIAAEALKKAGVYDKSKLFGITTLDRIRANTFVANLKNKHTREINVQVIGGHSGSTILPLFSKVKNISFSKEEIIKLTNLVQNAGNEVVNAKLGNGSATLSMAQAACDFSVSLIKALQGQNNIIECAYVEGDGIYARFFAQPFLLGQEGIIEYKKLEFLSDFEYQMIDQMLPLLKEEILKAEIFVRNMK